MITATFKRSFVAALALAAIGLGPRADASTIVDTQLAMGVDVSGSVSAANYNLQMNGYIAAFENASIRNAITNSSNGIATMLYHWSGNNQQSVVADWAHLTDAASIDAFVTTLQAHVRSFFGLTAIGSAISYAVDSIANNGFDSTRKVIDISGDGTNNNGISSAAGRDIAVAEGITVNGLAIGSPALLTYFQNNVIGGDGAFALGVSQFEDFEDAVIRKIRAEITGEDPNGVAPIPLPAAGWLLLTALGGLGVYSRRRRQAA